MHFVDLALHHHVGLGLKCKRASLRLQLGAGKGTLDVFRPGVVPFNQIRVVGIHHANEVGELGCGLGMKPSAKISRFPLNLDG